ncbi:MAG TPA: hypothetical protein VFX49_16985, partial [Chloroflexota bacterium]|nr:hypothetical protein [Chloroflexota bacterium]
MVNLISASFARRTFIRSAAALAPLTLAGRALAEGEEQSIPAEAPPAEAPVAETVAETPPAPAAPPAPVYPEPGFAYGMQGHLYFQDVPRTLDLVRGAGFEWVKQQ